MNCVFCKIASGTISALKIYEDEKIISVIDINPVVRGHIMVIPKKHSRWLWDMDDEDYLYLKKKTKYLAGVLRKAFDTEWIEEVVAGMGVPHTHIHLIPRRKDDGLPEVPTKILDPKPSEEEMKEIQKKIKENL